MVFPALFTAGMALIDTIDSVTMVRAYGWAFVNPMRKLWYNLTITAGSIGVAVLVGGIEILGLVARRLSLHGLTWGTISDLSSSLGELGLAVVGGFGVCWIGSVLAFRWRGYHLHPQ